MQQNAYKIISIFVSKETGDTINTTDDNRLTTSN